MSTEPNFFERTMFVVVVTATKRDFSSITDTRAEIIAVIFSDKRDRQSAVAASVVSYQTNGNEKCLAAAATHGTNVGDDDGVGIVTDSATEITGAVKPLK